MNKGFELVLPVDAAEPDALDLWRISAASESFEVDRPARERQAVWRLDLPQDSLAAAALIAGQEGGLGVAQAAVRDAGPRLREFVRDRAGRKGDESFDAWAADLREPERALAAWLGEPRDAASFFPGQGILAEARDLADEAQRFIAQVRDTLAYAARVETVQGGILVACTGITWLGDASTTGRTDLSSAQASLHSRSLATVVATRGAWIRLVTQLTQNAFLAAAGLFSGNLVVGLAAAWKFVKAILDEWRRRQAMAPA